MSDLFWLSAAQMARLKPCFPKSYGQPRVDDRGVLSGIVFINRNGLRWRDAPKEYGPHKTLFTRWKRWSDKGVFARIMTGLADEYREKKTVMIDATYLKAHRTATSMGVKKGGALTLDHCRQGISKGNIPRGRTHQGRHEYQAARGLR